MDTMAVILLLLLLLLPLLLLLLLLVLVLVLLVFRNCLNNTNTKRLTNTESHTPKSRKYRIQKTKRRTHANSRKPRGAQMRTLENQEAHTWEP